MPRLPPITQREQVAEPDRPAFDAVFASRGRINAPQSMLMYVPQISARSSSLNDALRELLSEADFELAVLGAAREFDIDFVWAAQIIVSFSRELVGKHQLSAEAFDAARAELGERCLIEVLAAIGYYISLGCVLIATDMELPPGAQRLPH